MPEPYVWNTEFAVNYEQMDSEHVGLFELLLAVETDPTNQEKVDILQERMREHFYNEEEKFCDAIDLPWDYCQQHKKKHVLFSGKFSKMKAPVNVSEVKWAQGKVYRLCLQAMVLMTLFQACLILFYSHIEIFNLCMVYSK